MWSPMNIEISYRDHEPDLLSQSLTGSASTSLGSWRGSRQKRGSMMHTQTTRPGRSRNLGGRRGQGQAGQVETGNRGRRGARGATGRETHPRPALSHCEASARRRRSLAPAASVPLDSNAKVRVMMVARALMPLFAEFSRTFGLSTSLPGWRPSNAATEPSDEHERGDGRCRAEGSDSVQERD